MGQQNGNLSQGSSINQIFSPSEINKLYKRFAKLDAEGQGYLTIDSFMEIPAFRQNPLSQ